MSILYSVGQQKAAIDSGYIDGLDCRQCKILREFLDAEIAKREYYEKILLTRAGVITTEDNIDLSDESTYPSVHRTITMSAIKRAAKDIRLRQSEAKITTKEELTEGEKIFQDSLK